MVCFQEVYIRTIKVLPLCDGGGIQTSCPVLKSVCNLSVCCCGESMMVLNIFGH